uniref:HECT and RLD domain containing E3 ubiquitin protein ligase family member 6 n=1 Tax=Anabas testudineus TaxID=64144 RepID=A0A7N6AUS0_ANATE
MMHSPHLSVSCPLRPLAALCNIPVQQVACGSQHSLALTVYTWGQDSRGQLGLGKRKAGARSPQHLRCVSEIPVVQVSAGGEQSFILSVSGGVFSWGRNDCGQLVIYLVHRCSKIHFSKDGQVYTWGQDSRGQLGLGKRISGVRSPQHLRCVSEIPVVQVSAGGEQSFILSVSGGLFSWGRNDCGQLGLGDTTDRHTPTPVRHLNMKKTVHVSCGKDHTATLTKDGAVFTFGSGQHGQLGHNSFRNELRPRLVAELWGAKVIQVACGRYSTIILHYICGCSSITTQIPLKSHSFIIYDCREFEPFLCSLLFIILLQEGLLVWGW